MKRKCIQILLLTALTLHTMPSSANTNFSDLTILVSSCDKYAALWDPFFYSLFKHWPSLTAENQHLPIILVANTRAFPNERVQTINIPQERSWSDNILYALDKVNTKYVLIALEDYWISESVNEPYLREIFDVMQKEKLCMVQLAFNNPKFHFGTKHPTLKNAVYTDNYAQYKTTLQMAIWDKEALKCLLKPGENPWEFELVGTVRSHGYPGTFLNIAKDYPIRYLNATRQGHVESFALDYALANGIKFDRGNFPVVNGTNLKLEIAVWKNRLAKAWDFAKEPGSFYKTKSN